MGNWLLVMVIYAYGGDTVETQWFPTLEQCQKASIFIKQKMESVPRNMHCLDTTETAEDLTKRNALSKLTSEEKKALGIK